MFYYPNCRKLPIGKIDDNTVFLDFELDADYTAYLIRLIVLLMMAANMLLG